jgi:hypothetical protein
MAALLLLDLDNTLAGREAGFLTLQAPIAELGRWSDSPHDRPLR